MNEQIREAARQLLEAERETRQHFLVAFEQPERQRDWQAYDRAREHQKSLETRLVNLVLAAYISESAGGQ